MAIFVLVKYHEFSASKEVRALGRAISNQTGSMFASIISSTATAAI
jgi:hypothetical protein